MLISCHQCHGSLTVPHEAPLVTCPHCGAVNTVPTPVPPPQVPQVPPANLPRVEFNEAVRVLRGFPKWMLVVGALVLIGTCQSAIDACFGTVHTGTASSAQPESGPEPVRAAAGPEREPDAVEPEPELHSVEPEPEPYAVEQSKTYHGNGTNYFFDHKHAPPLTIHDSTDAWPATQINEALDAIELTPVSAEVAAAQVGWGRGYAARTFPGYPGGELRIERRICGSQSDGYDCVWKISFWPCGETDEQGLCPDK